MAFGSPSTQRGEPLHHDIYVGDRSFRVQKFEPSGEFVWAIGKGVNHTTSADLCTKASGNLCGFAAESKVAGGFASAVFLGVGPAGVLYVIDNVRPLPLERLVQQRLQRFDEAGAPVGSPVILLEGESKFARGMAIDATGDLWVGNQEEGLRKYSPTGTVLAGPIADTGFPLAAQAPFPVRSR